MASPHRALPLASLILRKTAGNPFFIRRILRLLHQSGLLTLRSPRRARWTWDLRKDRGGGRDRERRRPAARRAPAPARARRGELLATAACIGTTVPLGLLAAVGEPPTGDAPSGSGPPFATGSPRRARAHASDGAPGIVPSFAHDRSARRRTSWLEDEARKAIHARGGTAAPARRPRGAAVGRAALRHRRSARSRAGPRHPTRRAARALAAEPAAARKARGSSAYGPALEYLKRALALLPDGAWEARRRDTFGLHREAVESPASRAICPSPRSCSTAPLAQAASPVEKADLYNTRMYVSIAQAAREEAFRWGLEGVRLFGIELPVAAPEAAMARELAAIPANLRGRTPAALLEAPRMRAPEQLACMDLLSTLCDAASTSSAGAVPLRRRAHGEHVARARQRGLLPAGVRGGTPSCSGG